MKRFLKSLFKPDTSPFYSQGVLEVFNKNGEKIFAYCFDKDEILYIKTN